MRLNTVNIHFYFKSINKIKAFIRKFDIHINFNLFFPYAFVTFSHYSDAFHFSISISTSYSVIFWRMTKYDNKQVTYLGDVHKEDKASRMTYRSYFVIWAIHVILYEPRLN